MTRRIIILLALCMIPASCMSPSTHMQPPLMHSEPAVPGTAPHYTIEDLGTLGGSFSQADGVNNNGDVAGFSRTGADTTCCDAVLWRNGTITNLGALGLIASQVDENNPINDNDEVTGWLDTGIRDPSGENFCGVFEQAICLPFVWIHGTIHKLPVLGGRNAIANAINDNGEIAGMAEHGSPDTICPPPQVFHFAAVEWSSSGAIRELPAVPGDLDASAAGINGQGDVAGASGSCTLQPVRAVIWHNGVPSALPNLGGTGFNIAFAINNKSEAVGQSDLPGDLTHHAALWRGGTVRDLGTLYGLDVSLANGINNNTQVVGFSQDDQNVTFVAMLWQNGVLYDLNTLIPANSGLYLLEALGINDRGQIAGYAFDFAENDLHGFLLTPIGDAAPLALRASPARLTDEQRRIVRAKLNQFSRYHFWPRKTMSNRQ